MTQFRRIMNGDSEEEFNKTIEGRIYKAEDGNGYLLELLHEGGFYRVVSDCITGRKIVYNHKKMEARFV